MTDDEWKKFLKSTKPSGKCLLWTGPTFGEGGYAFWKEGKTLAHREAYRHYHGKLSQKSLVVQTCGNKGCIAEEHLVKALERR